MPVVNHEVKGQLAKLLATENLIIEHKKVPTASFDVLRRVLTLPIWNRASSVVYDLLVGHEVGHALYTPNEDWTAKVPDNVPKDYVNVVEDARIEKLMKRKFPGLGRTFYNGYKELNDQDFFSIEDEDVSKMILIDRINLHFKIGAYAQIPFKNEEVQFVEMIEVAETFDDVLKICELLYEFTKQEISASMTSQDHLVPTIVQPGSGNQPQQGEGEIEYQVSGENVSNSSSQSQTEGTLDNGNDKIAESTPAPLGSGGGGPNEENQDLTSKTQQAFDEQAKSLSDNRFYSETYYVERPELNMKQVIAECGELTEYINNFFKENITVAFDTAFGETDKAYKNYRTEAQKEVNYLVKEFEMKKSADAYQRMATARTGVLDTKMLHTYKYNEDLFRKVSVIPDGKNHGLIFVLDWSGSMSDYLLDTVKQLFNLVWFCRKVQIPFEVYGFTYEWSRSFVDENYITKELYKRADGTINIHRRFGLLNFLSSKVNNKVLDQAMLNLWRFACRNDRYFYGAHFPIPCGLDLSGTPLNESIVALHQIIPQFKNNNKLQKVNVVILTDGEANGLMYDVSTKNRHGADYDFLGVNNISHVNALRDRKIGHVYRNFDMGNMNSNVTAILLENLKDNFPEVNLIGFRILGGASFSTYYRSLFNSSHEKIKDPEEVMKVWRKEKSYEINGGGYDALYMISSSSLQTDTSFGADAGDSANNIGKAFRTMLKKKATNKKLLSSFASLVS